LIDQRRFPVVNVSDDCDISDLRVGIHWSLYKVRLEKSGSYEASNAKNQPTFLSRE
jgi:hypothetical protein